MFKMATELRDETKHTADDTTRSGTGGRTTLCSPSLLSPSTFAL